jgi:DNA-binding XRE family transcriptional regulator
MKYCRISCRIPPSKVAEKLGIDTCTYKAIERGEILITPKQAKELGKFYNLKPNYIFQEAIQTDLLMTKCAIIRILQSKVQELQEKLGE